MNRGGASVVTVSIAVALGELGLRELTLVALAVLVYDVLLVVTWQRRLVERFLGI